MIETNIHKTKSQPAQEIVVSRIFDAPRELVFEAWTDSAHLLRWWAPKDCSTPCCKVELRPGGTFHFCIRKADGTDVWCLGVYKEIVVPERLVYTDGFSDAQGRRVEPSHYGLSAAHPLETLVTLTFTEFDGRTKVILRHAMPESVPERTGIQQGWNEMFDRLTGELALITGENR